MSDDDSEAFFRKMDESIGIDSPQTESDAESEYDGSFEQFFEEDGVDFDGMVTLQRRIQTRVVIGTIAGLAVGFFAGTGAALYTEPMLGIASFLVGLIAFFVAGYVARFLITLVLIWRVLP